MLYEFICGGTPFGEGLEDPYKVYEAVLTGHIRYPSRVNGSNPTRPIIEQLLSRNPAVRGRASAVMKNKWFSEFDWDSVINRCYEPSFKP
jgi:serine/threonine protein kinase